jgi:hypothetical protein
VNFSSTGKKPVSACFIISAAICAVQDGVQQVGFLVITSRTRIMTSTANHSIFGWQQLAYSFL